MDLSTETLSLIACYGLCLYISLKCFTPPHIPSPSPPPSTPTTIKPITPPKDTLHDSFAASALHIWFIAFGLIFIYQLLLILFPSLLTSSTPTCLNPSLLDPDIMVWSRQTVMFVTVVLLAGGLRLEAFRELGKNFTFVLSRPSTLVQTGLYKYIQHPSYTGLIPLLFAWYGMLLRLDGMLACFLPKVVLGMGVGTESWIWRWVLRWMLGVGMAGLSLLAARGRVKEEEEMIKREFGNEWIEWSRVTRRFVPGVW